MSSFVLLLLLWLNLQPHSQCKLALLLLFVVVMLWVNIRFRDLHHAGCVKCGGGGEGVESERRGEEGWGGKGRGDEGRDVAKLRTLEARKTTLQTYAFFNSSHKTSSINHKTQEMRELSGRMGRGGAGRGGVGRERRQSGRGRSYVEFSCINCPSLRPRLRQQWTTQGVS